MKSKKEIWKPVPEYEGIYEVSNLGRIKSLSRGKRKEKILNPNSGRYKNVFLSKNGDYCKMLLHRIVAIVFIPNPENKPQVNHKDGNKFNNEVSNLEWCTHQENMNHAYVTGLIPKYTDELKEIRRKARIGYVLHDETKEKIRKSLSIQIKCLDNDKVFSSIKEASIEIGVNSSTFHRKFRNGELINGKQFIQWHNLSVGNISEVNKTGIASQT